MSIAERYLAFATPPIISSSEFVTEFISYQPSGSVKDFSQGDSFTISLANLSKAQFAVPDSCFLTFDITVSAAAGSAGNVPSSNTDVGVMHTLDTVPRPAFGLPFLDAASCSVPGSANFDALPSSAEETAQYWYSTRLLASSAQAEGTLDRAATFKLAGRYNFAGAKSGYERAGCISGARRIRDSAGVELPTPVSIRGNSITYAIPLSAFCTLFCKASALIPIGYLSSGGEALVFQYTVARDIASVLGVAAGTQGWGDITFRMSNPRILATIVRVQNPVTVSQISALYDARIKAVLPPASPGAQPVSISVPMVVAHKRFLWSRTVVPKVTTPSYGSSSNLGLTFSGCNEPSVSAIILRFRYRPGGITTPDAAARKACALRYLGGEEPDIVLRDLQARINDQLVPLQGLSDEGVSTVPAYKVDGTTPNASADGSTVVVQSSGGTAAAMWDLGRHGLGLFLEEDHAQSLSDVVFDHTSAKGTGAQIAGTNGVMGRIVENSSYSLVEGSGTKPLTCQKTPMSIVIIPLTTMPQLVGDFSNAHTLRSWDLRSVSSFSVTATVQVKKNIVSAQDPNQVNTFLSSPESDIICDGALVCDGMLRLAAGSSDSRYVFSAVAAATVGAL